MMRSRSVVGSSLLFVLTGSACLHAPVPVLPPLPVTTDAAAVSDEQVQAIFANRCVNLWPMVDWIRDDFRRAHPSEFGLFDLNRYKNL